MPIPIFVPNHIFGEDRPAGDGRRLSKINPHDGKPLAELAASSASDAAAAVDAAGAAFPEWSKTTPVRRGQILGAVAAAMASRRDELAEAVAVETGKPLRDAAAEVGGAILQGEFFAGEGMRLYGRSLTSAVPGKMSHTIRQPHGIAALIVPANTPIANIAWKAFPALICGNTTVLKASEDAPYTALLLARIATEAGLPPGALNVVQGTGNDAGRPLVEDSRCAVISFTGSTAVGRWIAETVGRRLGRVSLELGGKNPFVVCDDADIDNAVKWALLSAFSNAGQRCAAGSRMIVMAGIYDQFVDRLVTGAAALKLGVDADCDLGPVINERQLQSILAAIAVARSEGGEILVGGERSSTPHHAGGYYLKPTVIGGLRAEATISRTELFGPVASVYRVTSLNEAVVMANTTEYGLTAAIHTRDVDRAFWFCRAVRAGVANINCGTFGSEPHMPFGGFGASGNGTREPGTEALDVYSELKNISVLVRDPYDK